MKMKIFQLGMHSPASSGGADRYFEGLGNSLSSSHTITGIAFENGEGLPPRWIKLIGSSRISVSRKLIRIRREIKNWVSSFSDSEDAVLVSHFALYSLAAIFLRLNCPHIVHFHGPWALEAKAEGAGRPVVFIKFWIEKIVYRRADHFIVLSNAFKELLVEYYGIESSRITVIPGAIEREKFVIQPRSHSRNELEWSQSEHILLCVRRLTSRMGLENLIEAFNVIHKDRPNLRLLIAGRGRLRGLLGELIIKLELSDKIQLLGFVPDHALAHAYSGADLTIVPSQSLEGFGLTALESLVCGTPVLVTPVGGLPEVVSSLNSRLILKSAAINDLAEGIRNSFDQIETLPNSEECREYALSNFDWSVISMRIAEVYTSIIKSKDK